MQRRRLASDSTIVGLAALVSVAVFGAIVCSAAPNNRTPDPTPWANPCRGVFVQLNANSPKEPLKKAQVYNELYGNLTRFLHIKTINITAGNSPLNSSKWTKAIRLKYAFLPVPKKTGITLISWHRQAQIYLGTVIALQRRFYGQRQQSASASSQLLMTFRSDTRQVLCELENAVNLTRPASRSIRVISTAAMAKLLPFGTHPQAANDGINHFILFALKRRWTKFLRTIMKILRKHNRKHNRRHNRKHQATTKQKNPKGLKSRHSPITQQRTLSNS